MFTLLPALLACASEFEPFDAAVEGFLVAEGLEGATVVVVDLDEGVLHRRGYGAFEEDRVSLIASSSKVLSAGVLVALSDQGLLDLDEPVSTYLADWGEHKTDITTAQLLSNSSGMVGLTDDPYYTKYLCQYLPTGTLSGCAETIYTADDEADREPPDTVYRYGGAPWQMAGGLAEVVSGKSWAQLVEETYLEPCGLENTGYNNHFMEALSENSDEGIVPYPEFFDGDPSTLEPTDNPNLEGGAYTTVVDYEKILLLHLSGGLCGEQRVLSEEGVARMQEDRIGEVYGGTSLLEDYPGYGFGWFVSREVQQVYDGGAYGAAPWLDLDRGYGAMILLEGSYTQGSALREEVQPLLEQILDARD